METKSWNMSHMVVVVYGIVFHLKQYGMCLKQFSSSMSYDAQILRNKHLAYCYISSILPKMVVFCALDLGTS